MERFRIVEDESGFSRIQAVEKRRFLFWTWESVRWFAGTGLPSKDELGKDYNKNLVDRENAICDVPPKSNPNPYRVTYDPLAERSLREAQP